MELDGVDGGVDNIKVKKKKKQIVFDDDVAQSCTFCKKEFSSENRLQEHLENGDTKCALKHKLATYKKNFTDLKELSMKELAEKDAIIASLSAQTETNKPEQLQKSEPSPKQEPKSEPTHKQYTPLGIPEKNINAIKMRLSDFHLPSSSFINVAIHKYKKLYPKDKESAFLAFFKSFLDNGKKHKPIGLFITNSFGQYGLVIKCNDELLLDTSGIVMTFIRMLVNRSEPKTSRQSKNST